MKLPQTELSINFKFETVGDQCTVMTHLSKIWFQTCNCRQKIIQIRCRKIEQVAKALGASSWKLGHPSPFLRPHIKADKLLYGSSLTSTF